MQENVSSSGEGFGVLLRVFDLDGSRVLARALMYHTTCLRNGLNGVIGNSHLSRVDRVDPVKEKIAGGLQYCSKPRKSNLSRSSISDASQIE